MSVLFVVLALLGFGFVILIHELGHFVFAKWAGVRIETFSIGFGPRLLGWRSGDTDYRISLLPLGGYVKMLGQEDLPENADLAAAAPADSYLAKSAPWKALILLGGVLFNFLSSYLILLALAAWGMPVIRPVVGEVQAAVIDADGRSHPSPAARLGLRAGDEIRRVNGERVRGFDDLQVAVLMGATRPLSVEVRRPGEVAPLVLDGGGGVTPLYSPALGAAVLGVDPAQSTRIADLAGAIIPADLHAGDRVVAVDGRDLPVGTSGQDVRHLLSAWYGREVRLGIEREGERREAIVRWGGGGLGAVGLPVRVRSVWPDSGAAAAGLEAGDVLIGVDGVPAAGLGDLLARVRQGLDAQGRVQLALLRDGVPRLAMVAGTPVAGRQRLGLDLEPVARGVLPGLPPSASAGGEGEGPLAAAGLRAGDAIVELSEAGGSATVGVLAVRGGERVVIPLGEEAHRVAQRTSEPGRLAALLGRKAAPSLYRQLIGARVEACLDAEGRPLGAPLPGMLVLRRADGTPVTIDLTPLGSAAAPLIAALREGDWIVASVPSAKGPAIEVVRGAERTPMRVAVAIPRGGLELDFAIETAPYRLEGAGEAFAIANRATHTMVWRSLTFIPRFFRPAEQGGIDATKQLQGPIGIFSALKGTAERLGFDSFLRLVALIGLNLVLVNLLPIPITDGGQLVFLGIESAIGRPLPAWLRNAAAWAGLMLVIGLMLYVTSLDVLRRL